MNFEKSDNFQPLIENRKFILLYYNTSNFANYYPISTIQSLLIFFLTYEIKCSIKSFSLLSNIYLNFPKNNGCFTDKKVWRVRSRVAREINPPLLHVMIVLIWKRSLWFLLPLFLIIGGFMGRLCQTIKLSKIYDIK